MSSSHGDFGLPTGLLVDGFHLYIFLTMLVSGILFVSKPTQSLGFNIIYYFDVLLTVLHLSIFISVINQHVAQNFGFTISLFHASTCLEHICSSIRRSKLHYTASGIITLKQVSGLKLLKYNSINMSK